LGAAASGKLRYSPPVLCLLGQPGDRVTHCFALRAPLCARSDARWHFDQPNLCHSRQHANVAAACAGAADII
jgi:hypothetical protein